MSPEPRRYLLLGNPTSGSGPAWTRQTFRPRPWGWGRRVRRDAVSVGVELRQARPFALDGGLLGPARSLAIEGVPRALNVLVPGRET